MIRAAIVSISILANLILSGNLYLEGHRASTDPIKIFMGPDDDNGIYIFVQERPEGLWGGLESFKRPAAGPVAAGYGAYPLRVWAKNWLLEANGDIVGENIVTDKVYIGGLRVGAAGVSVNYDDLGTYISRDSNGDVVLFNHNREVARWK